MTDKFDTVDVHVTSQTYRVDAILQDPLLDGQKRYTVEVTEFTCPLSSESPLPATALFENTDNYQLIRSEEHTSEHRQLPADPSPTKKYFVSRRHQ